jgi:antitoxin HigA-1
MPDKYIPAPPVSPGDLLRKMLSEKITQDRLADAMGVSRFTVNQIINGRRGVTADMALRLARVTSTTPDFWLNLQIKLDLYRASLKLGADINKLEILRQPRPKHELFRQEG